MLTFAFPPARRRRRLALAGALFLAFDAVLMGVAVAWITQGEHLGLAVALAGAGAGVSCLLAWVLARPPRAVLEDGGTLRIEAAHRAFVLDRDALRGAIVREIDLATLPRSALPGSLQRMSRWRTDDAMGWQRGSDGRPVFCAITRIGPALQVDAGESGVLLWTPDDAASARRAIADAVAG